MKLLLALASTLVLVGCAAPKHNYHGKAVSLSEPPLGTVQSSTVGDVMLRQAKYRENDALYLAGEAKPVWAYTMSPGYYLKHGEDEDGEYFHAMNSGEDGGRVSKNPIADPFIGVMSKRASQEVCVITFINVAACGQVPHEKRVKQSYSHDSFQQTLIYSGKVGNKINIGYREFSNNMARPAFNNNVEYDLSESSTIAYKGARIEVIEATNQLIRYRVLRNFNDGSQ